jgi:hypothetical protein
LFYLVLLGLPDWWVCILECCNDMNNLKDWTIQELLKSFELLARQAELRLCLKRSPENTNKEIEEYRAEILRRFPCADNTSKS